MSNTYKTIVFALIFVFGGHACSIDINSKAPDQSPNKPFWRCDLPQSEYKESDFIGIWQTDFRSDGNRVDQLILASDGTYQQRFSNFDADYQYASEWQDWWLDARESGGYQLHFEGMKFCGGVSGTCVDPGVIELGFYDFCEDNWFNLSGELVLSAIRDASAPGMIRLRHLKPAGYDTYYVNYTRIE